MELSELKTMLQLKDDKRDDILKIIIKDTEQALSLKLGLENAKPIPDELDYIVRGVAVKRYNRLANEGMSTYSQEGESITYNADDFDEYMDDINRWKDDHDKGDNLSGRFLFI